MTDSMRVMVFSFSPLVCDTELAMSTLAGKILSEPVVSLSVFFFFLSSGECKRNSLHESDLITFPFQPVEI